MKNLEPQIVLASASKGRRMLFEWFGLPFTTAITGFPEEEVKLEDFDDPAEYIQAIAVGKALMAIEQFPQAIVITADSGVFLDGKHYGKPNNLDEARQFLLDQSGKDVEVITAVSVVQADIGHERTEVSRSIVRFLPMGPDIIEQIIETGEAVSLAGGFDILGKIRPFIRDIQGSPSGVIGLPLFLVQDILEELGVVIEVDLRRSLFDKTGWDEPTGRDDIF